MGELSDQQREFCRLVSLGKSGREAYAAAYGCDMKSAAAAASRMLKRVYIQAEINRLMAATREAARERNATRERKVIGDKADRMEMLWRMACDSEEAGDVNEAVNCVKELNKMDGAYAPEKIELSSDEVFRREVLKATGAEPMVRSQGFTIDNLLLTN